MPERATFEVLRKRAYELADTGDYHDWEELAMKMETEGYADAAKRLRSDPMPTNMLNTRCWQARHKND
jgi:hypothetical protein